MIQIFFRRNLSHISETIIINSAYIIYSLLFISSQVHPYLRYLILIRRAPLQCFPQRFFVISMLLINNIHLFIIHEFILIYLKYILIKIIYFFHSFGQNMARHNFHYRNLMITFDQDQDFVGMIIFLTLIPNFLVNYFLIIVVARSIFFQIIILISYHLNIYFFIFIQDCSNHC